MDESIVNDEIIQIDSDNGETDPHNYGQSRNSPTQIDLQAETDVPDRYEHPNPFHTYNQNNAQSIDPYDEPFDDVASLEFFSYLRTKHRHNEQMAQFSNAQATFVMEAASEFDSTSAATVVAATSIVPTASYSADHRSQSERFTNTSRAKFGRGVSNDLKLLKNTPVGTSEWTSLVKSIEKQLKQQAVNELKQEYHLVPKNTTPQSRETAGKPKMKRKHHGHEHKRKTGDGHQRLKKKKKPRDSSKSSLTDSLGPSTSNPPYSGDRKSSQNSGSYSVKRQQQFRFGNDFHFGRPHFRPNQNHPVDTLKNVDKSLYLNSPAAQNCLLCGTHYKRMVNHFRKVHSDNEVFVSRISQRMADSLVRTQLPAIKYTRPTGVQYLKMMCPFCESERDFFAPYWANHIRTHTGEYTNTCIDCGTVSLSATHCGWPTSKQQTDLHEMGLTAFLCIRCNYVQIDESRIISHLKTQHGADDTAVTSIDSEYKEIVIIPPLKKIGAHVNPNDNNVQVNIVENPSMASALSTGTMNPNDDAMGGDDASYLYEFGNETDKNDADLEITAEFLSNSGTASGYSNIISNKIETVDEQTLVDMFDIYNNRIDNTSAEIQTKVIRPWIDYDYGRKLHTDQISQFALYKCMHELCIFATNSIQKWFIHMGIHLQLIAYFQSKGYLNTWTRSRLIKFRECGYCGYEAKADHEVIRHMEEEHRRSIFQCALCFYRTIEMDNMVVHMRKFHATSGRTEILLCGETREFEQQDDELLEQDCETHVDKIRCGQDDCTEKYACYKNLYAHLAALHRGTYVCPYCNQTMGLDETVITEHLSKVHTGLEEFQCLKCKYGFNNVHAIREHMSVVHPSNYLFVGARCTFVANENSDEIQVIYVGDAQDITPYKLLKCSQPNALNGMNPRELYVNRQRDTLQKLHIQYKSITVSERSVPKISIRPGDRITLVFTKYEEYVQLNERQDKTYIPSTIEYKCITNKLVDDVSQIAVYIDRTTEIEPNECKADKIPESMRSMLLHRLGAHAKHPIVFLQSEQQPNVRVDKIVRCTFQCQLCAEHLDTRTEIIRHFIKKHSDHWIAAKICLTSHVVESNDPQQPISMCTESIDHFYCSAMKCTQPHCDCVVGTRTQAIAHYNAHHNAIGSQMDGFQFVMGENIIAYHESNIHPYMQEIEQSHQMHLFECQHCWQLIDSYDAMKQHFTAVHNENAKLELRFVVKRLFRCLEDNTVRTFAGMKQYESKHPDKKPIIPRNVLLPLTYCGLCDHNYKKNNDLRAHYARRHRNGYSYTDGFLKSLKLRKIDINLCKFASGCCENTERNLLRQIVEHVLECERRFVCTQCPDRKFSSTPSFVLHYSTEHNQNVDAAKVVDDLHDFKRFLSLFANMHIIFPTGLVMTMNEIRDTAFAYELHGKIGQITEKRWEQEKLDVNFAQHK